MLATTDKATGKTEAPLARPRVSPAPPALTWRSLAIGLAGVVFLSVWTQYAELIVHGTQITLTFPPIGGFIIYVLLVGFNELVQRLARRRLLTGAEMVCIFCMLTMASCVASLDVAQRLVPYISGFFYYANPQNDWKHLVIPHLPKWLTPWDYEAIRGLYEGSKQGIPWQHWYPPLAWWSVFILAMFHVMFCLVALVRQQWIHNERLTFPLVALPIEIAHTRDPKATPLLRSRAMWLGFGAAFLLTFYVGVNIYFPQLPQLNACFWGVPVNYSNAPKPWNALGTITYAVLPLIVGLAFLFTTEIAFSMVFFYWMLKLEYVVGTASGLDLLKNNLGTNLFPFLPQQMAGAFLGLILSALIAARQPLTALVRRALGPEGTTLLLGEPMSPRSALIGVLLGFVLMLVWCSSAGLPVWVAALLLTLSFVFLLAITRLMAEAGMPWAQEPDMQAHSVLVAALGTRSLAPAAWVGVGMQFFSSFDLRVSIMPRILQSYKMGDLVGTSARQLFVAMWIGCLISLPIGLWAFIRSGYQYGGISINPYRFSSLAQAPGNFLTLVLKNRNLGTDWMSLGFVSLGALTVLLLTFLRFHFLWWPLHPAAFAMGFSVYLHKEWLSVLVAAVLKAAILRYGGRALYDRLRPFFLGLVFGAIMAAAAFLVIDQITGVQHHKILY